MTGRRRKRRKQPHSELKETRRCWELKEEALGRAVWRSGFERGYGHVVRETAERLNTRPHKNGLSWPVLGTMT